MGRVSGAVTAGCLALGTLVLTAGSAQAYDINGGTLVVPTSGGTMVLTGLGCHPYSLEYLAWGQPHASGVALGQVETDASGRFTATVHVPPASEQAVIAASPVNDFPYCPEVRWTVIYESTSGSLPFTGFSIGAASSIAAILAAVGVAAVFLGRRKLKIHLG